MCGLVKMMILKTAVYTGSLSHTLPVYPCRNFHDFAYTYVYVIHKNIKLRQIF